MRAMRRRVSIDFCRVVLALLTGAARLAATETWVSEAGKSGDFPLVADRQAAAIVVAPEDFKVVSIAAHDLAADIERVTGVRPAVETAAPSGSEVGRASSRAVLAGTLGHSALIDSLVAAGRLDVSALRGRWESFLIATVPAPSPDAGPALVIVGSDRRGTAFGLYELSQAIGVSPWYWWADVAPEKKHELYVAAGTRKFGPPSVQYRGIFINDEDWGLQPWAAKTFEPEDGGIGPKTYARVFELLLRLKANTLWPAMHACTKPFNADPRNAQLADDYAIVMGSSHAEPMLRNNVGEWPHDHAADYNYVTNREGVRRYWEERVASNARFENIYTLGMRGVHDSMMVGPKTDTERIATLTRIFADQRAMLARYVNPHADQVPQIFCAYNEVLGLYRQGLQVADDVTIVWPDDNHGYIRDFPTDAERQRSGGFGVYYHVSYLGRPLSYLWLCTTPPALIWEEMSKAYDHGARRIWILNVGDIKPAEIATEFFFQMAWDITRWRRDNLPDYLREWAAREFGSRQADKIADVMAGYYRLNFSRKPEHLQWWLPGQPEVPSPLTEEEREQRLKDFASLVVRAGAIHAQLEDWRRDAFFELVGYPVRGSALANGRYFWGEIAALRHDKSAADRAGAADARLLEQTRYFNEELAGGKWRGLMSPEPADGQWSSMRIAPWRIPQFAGPPDPAPAPVWRVMLAANSFASSTERGGTAWQIIPGLGRSDGAMAVFPTTAAPVDLASAATRAPRLDYAVQIPESGEIGLRVHVLPTHPLVSARGLQLAVALDDGPAQLITLAAQYGGPEWANGVLSAERVAATTLRAERPGAHVLHVYGLEPGVVLDRLELSPVRSTDAH
jgi:hypothetical protein